MTTPAVVELRRYALRPEARDTLIELFDRELVEPQEDLQMQILGQFRDLDDPNSFVWLRGFTDMGSRQRGLEAFYSGPTWKAHAAAANATMVDVDNVLLLRPLGGGLVLEGRERPPRTSSTPGRGLLSVTIYHLARSTDAFAVHFDTEIAPSLAAPARHPLATYVTEHSPNTYPALPVREDVDVFVALSMYDDAAAHERHLADLRAAPRWAEAQAALRERWLERAPEELRLTPTPRSLLHA